MGESRCGGSGKHLIRVNTLLGIVPWIVISLFAEPQLLYRLSRAAVRSAVQGPVCIWQVSLVRNQLLRIWLHSGLLIYADR